MYMSFLCLPGKIEVWELRTILNRDMVKKNNSVTEIREETVLGEGQVR